MAVIQLMVNGIASGALCALMAVGFGLIYGTTRVFHIAHGAVYTVAAYALFWALKQAGLPLGVGILAALLVAGLLGVAIEAFVYRPLHRRSASPAVAMLSSFGLYIAIVNIIPLLFGSELKLLTTRAGRSYHLGPIAVAQMQAVEIAVLLAVGVVLVLVLRHTAFGHSIRALRDNQALASVLGINTSVLRIAVFGLASALAGASACLYALDVGLDPQMGLAALLAAAVAVIVGGVGVFEGAILGAFLLGLLQNLVVYQFSARWANAAVFVVLICFLVARPIGILGHRRRVEEL